jgi:hypothetical protein
MFKPVLLLMIALSIASCAETAVPVRPPACPEAGDLVADDAARLRPLGLVELRDWLGRVQRHCEAIDAMRGGS